MKREKLLLSLLYLIKSQTFKVIYLVLLFGGCIYYLFNKTDELYNLLRNADMPIIGLAFGIYCCTMLEFIFIYYCVYRGMNVAISYPTTFKIVCLSLLGKYIPGKIWVAGNYYLFSKEAGVKTEYIGLSFIIVLFAITFTGSICSIPLISYLSPYLKCSIVILPIITGIFLHPKILNRILSLTCGILSKYTERDKNIDFQVLKELKYYFYLKVIGLLFLNWILGGFILYYVLSAFEAIELINLPFCLSTGALAQIISMLAVFAPGGIGVKEGIGMVVLSHIASLESAFLAVVTMRIISVVVELGSGLIGVLFIHNLRR